MTQEEAAHLLKLISEIPTNTKKIQSTSSQQKESTPDSTSSQAEKHQFPPETSSPSATSLKVPQSATLNQVLEIKENTQDAQAPTPPSLDTPKMEPKPELDYHQEPERPSTAAAEPQSESSLEEEEMKNLS